MGATQNDAIISNFGWFTFTGTGIYISFNIVFVVLIIHKIVYKFFQSEKYYNKLAKFVIHSIRYFDTIVRRPGAQQIYTTIQWNALLKQPVFELRIRYAKFENKVSLEKEMIYH